MSTRVYSPSTQQRQVARPDVPEIAPIGLIAAETAVDRLRAAPDWAAGALVSQARANLGWAADTLEGLDAAAAAPLFARIRAVERLLAARAR